MPSMMTTQFSLASAIAPPASVTAEIKKKVLTRPSLSAMTELTKMKSETRLMTTKSEDLPLIESSHEKPSTTLTLWMPGQVYLGSA